TEPRAKPSMPSWTALWRHGTSWWPRRPGREGSGSQNTRTCRGIDREQSLSGTPRRPDAPRLQQVGVCLAVDTNGEPLNQEVEPASQNETFAFSSAEFL